MKIIISESKLEKMKQSLTDKVNEIGIYRTARMLGMNTTEFMDRFGFEMNDSRITDLIDLYMDNKFDKVYHSQKRDLCELYKTPETFLSVVIEAINEFCYNNFDFATHLGIDEESIEFENLFYQMEHYTIKNYGELIKNKFVENCTK
jgi:hypothetical protein